MSNQAKTFNELYPFLVFLMEVKSNPSKLDEDTEYSASVKDSVKKILDTNTGNSKEQTAEEVGQLDIEKEVTKVYNDTMRLELTYGGDVIDPRDKIAMMKLRTSLLEKLLDMVRESSEIKNIRQFEDAVFQVLKDQPEKIEQLEEILGKKGENK